jgi:flagellar basal body-associated protein FliL
MGMTATPDTKGPSAGRRRRYLAIAVVVAVLLAIVGLVAVWLFFFGSEAPEAPTIDNAIRVLLPSASPE